MPERKAPVSEALLADYAFDFKVARGVGALAQRLVYSDEELLVSLSNSLKLREHEIADRNSFTGRLMAIFVGKDPGDSIRIDGMRLNQLYDLAGSKPRSDIDLNGVYEVNLAHFQALLSKAKTTTKAKPETASQPQASK